MKGGLEAKLPDRSHPPAIAAQRAAALNAAADRLQFRFRPEHKMPMIGHDAVPQDPHRFALPGLLKHALERFVVARFLEEHLASDRTIEHVRSYAADNGPRASGHG